MIKQISKSNLMNKKTEYVYDIKEDMNIDGKILSLKDVRIDDMTVYTDSDKGKANVKMYTYLQLLRAKQNVRVSRCDMRVFYSGSLIDIKLDYINGVARMVSYDSGNLDKFVQNVA